MDKNILEQYIDACEVVKDTEEDIKKLRRQRKRIEQDIVKGSSHDFPYTAKNYHIEGLAYSVVKDPVSIKALELVKERQKEAAGQIKIQVEAWMLTIPQRMQRIIRYRVFEGKSWAQVAVRMGRKATEDSVKKEYQRFMGDN